MVASGNRKWWALALLSVVQFMVVLDIAIVNVALPSIQVDLGFSQENLQWVVSAYALVFGGFLLLGGRAADMLGRRRVFMGGLGVFTIGSFARRLRVERGFSDRGTGGAGTRCGDHLARRALDPHDDLPRRARPQRRARRLGRRRRFRCRGRRAARRHLHRALSWEWIFFVNTPVAVAAIALAPVLLGESRDRSANSFDALGALLVTGGLSTAVFGITQANHYGWSSGTTIGVFAGAIALLAAFVVRRDCARAAADDVLDLPDQDGRGANVAGFILGTSLFSMFLMLTLYMQQVLGYSAMKTGVAYLAVARASIVWAGVAASS